jgi:hypothetical protein
MGHNSVLLFLLQCGTSLTTEPVGWELVGFVASPCHRASGSDFELPALSKSKRITRVRIPSLVMATGYVRLKLSLNRLLISIE